MPTLKYRDALTKIRRRQHRNPIHLAREWQKAINSGEYSSPAALAYHLGVSRARVTQIMNLLKLSPEVIEAIYTLGDPIKAHMITERSLRPLPALPDEQQKAHIDNILSRTG